jgi:hypothetical protein
MSVSPVHSPRKGGGGKAWWERAAAHGDCPSANCQQEAVMTDKATQTKGREANAAQPLGERPGLVSKAGAERAGKESTRRAGPDGPDAAQVGDTFKKAP